MPDDTFNIDHAVEFFTRGKRDVYDKHVAKVGEDEYPIPRGSLEDNMRLAVERRIKKYVANSSNTKPVAIGVFGPPGSGKTTLVKKMADGKSGIADFKTINLSQLKNTDELEKIMKDLSDAPVKNEGVRLVFFDEFDSDLNGVSLGWLKWFLVPMLDGEFPFGSEHRELKRVIFVFGGGTADSFEDFEARHRDYFVLCKGPDFLSRLKGGIINVEGVNTLSEHRFLKRTIALDYELSQRAKNLDRIKQFDPELIRRIIGTGFYRHGGRSLEAILDLSNIPMDGNSVFDIESLPDESLLKLHIGLGKLENVTVGILSGEEKIDQRCSSRIAKALLRRGATLIIGGEITFEDSTFTEIVNVVKKNPKELIEGPKRLKNYRPYPSYFKNDQANNARSYKEVKDDLEEWVEFCELNTLSQKEKHRLQVKSKWFKATGKKYNVDHHLAWAISLFRMRVQLIQDVDAVVVIGGKKEASWGRFSGIAEEVMLAKAMGKPVYLIGLAGGAAEEIGQLMGLAAAKQGRSDCLIKVPDCFKSKTNDRNRKEFNAAIKRLSGKFKVPNLKKLPLTLDDLVTFFASGGPLEPNGLTPKENRVLFNACEATHGGEEKAISCCIDLIIQGLSQRSCKDE